MDSDSSSKSSGDERADVHEIMSIAMLSSQYEKGPMFPRNMKVVFENNKNGAVFFERNSACVCADSMKLFVDCPCELSCPCGIIIKYSERLLEKLLTAILHYLNPMMVLKDKRVRSPKNAPMF